MERDYHMQRKLSDQRNENYRLRMEMERQRMMMRDPRCREFFHEMGRWPEEGECWHNPDFEARRELMRCMNEPNPVRLIDNEQFFKDCDEYGNSRTEKVSQDSKTQKRRKLFWARYAKNKLIFNLIKA